MNDSPSSVHFNQNFMNPVDTGNQLRNTVGNFSSNNFYTFMVNMVDSYKDLNHCQSDEYVNPEESDWLLPFMTCDDLKTL